MLAASSRGITRSALSRSGGALTSSEQRFRSTNVSAREDEGNPKGFYPVYVHHVSKIALEHLQRNRSDWIMEKGLHNGMHINPNGTFTLKFPAKKGFDAGRIWTSYDSSKKQHWLSVYRQRLAVRFLLKDHGRSVETTNVHDSRRIEKEIQLAVDQMLHAINQTEAERESSARKED